MVHGDFSGGDYFIDCSSPSLSNLRTIWGIWMNVWIAIIAFCIHSIFSSRIKKRLLAKTTHQKHVNLWQASPGSTLSDLFEMRMIFIHSLRRGEFIYAFTSVVCVIVFFFNAASTGIANHTVVQNVVPRQDHVPGDLVTYNFATTGYASVNISQRVNALDYAKAPLSQLFDFVPNDTSGWIFVLEQWNNSWQGYCNVSKYSAVDLVVYPTNSPHYQDLVPALGNYLPQWAQDAPGGDVDIFGSAFNSSDNSTGYWEDALALFVFGSVVNATSPPTTYNISFANFLTHNVGMGSQTGVPFVETAFRSDVDVFECSYNRTIPVGPENQANPGDNYQSIASNFEDYFGSYLLVTSRAGGPVIQPDGNSMIRFWQAYESVKDTQNLHPVQRTLTVLRPVVQIRLSILVATIGTFLIAVVIAIIEWLSEPLDQSGRRLELPLSLLAWMVQASRERFRGTDFDVSCSPATYALLHKYLDLTTSTTPDGQATVVIWAEWLEQQAEKERQQSEDERQRAEDERRRLENEILALKTKLGQ